MAASRKQRLAAFSKYNLVGEIMKKITYFLLSALLAVIAFASCAAHGGDKTAYLYQASKDTANRFFNVAATTEEITYGEYVTKENLPGIPKEGCMGATKLVFHSSSYRTFDKLYLQLNYTVEELEEMKSAYKSAKFSVYFQPQAGVDIIYQGGQSHMLSFVEFYNSGWNKNQVHKNTWSSYEIFLGDFIACMQTAETASDGQTAYIFAGFFSNGHEILNATMNVYLTNIELIKKAA